MVAWRIGIVLLGLSGACHSVPTVAGEPGQGPSATASGLPDHGAAPPVSPLALWPPCSSPETLARVKPICFSADPAGIDLSNRFLRLIRSAEGNFEMLCDVDTMIVRSLQDCVISRPRTPDANWNAQMLSGLVITMAQAWRKQGELRRADEHYRYYFEGFAGGRPHGGYFKAWASVKLTLGEWDAAKDLASRYVAYNRDLYDCDRSFLPSLVSSLQFQVDLLETVDGTQQAAPARTEELARARTELKRLAAIADEHCVGDRCSGCIEGVCRGSPGFEGGCLRSLERKE
jgi:hypothetical protein